MSNLQVKIYKKQKNMPLKNYIRDIQGFPKKGILFKDITPLLMDRKARNICLEILILFLKGKILAR